MQFQIPITTRKSTIPETELKYENWESHKSKIGNRPFLLNSAALVSRPARSWNGSIYQYGIRDLLSQAKKRNKEHTPKDLYC